MDNQSASVPKRQSWSISGTLITGNAINTVTLQAQFSEPGNYTVQITSSGSAAPTGTLTEATIQWSVDGNTTTRRVTVGTATEISGAASAVRVSVQDVLANTTYIQEGIFTTGDLGFSYGITITVSKGVRSTTETPPVLVPLSTGIEESDTIGGHSGDLGPGSYVLIPGGGLTVPVPANAGVTAVFLTATTPNDIIDPTELSTPPNIVLLGALNPNRIRVPANLGAWIPVPPGTSSVRLRNIRDPALFILPLGALIAGLTFGIDG
jgi:hypothetical protein